MSLDEYRQDVLDYASDSLSFAAAKAIGNIKRSMSGLEIPPETILHLSVNQPSLPIR